MSYIGKSPSGSGVRTRYYFTQTSGGGTSISGTDDNGKTLTYTDGEYVDVYLNGVLLVHGTDYGTGTANTISSLAALASGDVVEVVVYDIFNVAKINNEAVRKRYYKTASGSETSISGADDSGATITFPANAEIEVKLNGVALVQGTDYNTTTANTVGGLSALSAGQVVEIVVYERFVLGDTVSKADGGTFLGNVAVNGDLTVDTNTLHVDSTNNRVGVGTSSPSDLLELSGDTAQPAIRLTDADVSGLYHRIFTPTNTGLAISADTGNVAANSFVRFDVDGSERMRIDGGNVGIGTTSPSELLHVDGTIRSGSGTAADPSIKVGDNNTGFYYIGSNVLGFTTDGSERMRLDNATGSLYVGITDAADVFASTSGDNGVYIGQQGTASLGVVGDNRLCAVWNKTNGTGVIMEFKYNGGIKGTISTNGTSTAYNTTSDHRLKEAVVDMTGAISRVKQLAPKRFNFIADADTTVDGFLAHEAQTVVPEAITGTHNEVDDDGNPVYQSIDQSKLVPLLTAALKESITKIETLETEMTALKARVTALEDA